MEQQGASHEQTLERAQATLEIVLRQACTTDVRSANTGELIRIDEMLAIAGEAAKEVISADGPDGTRAAIRCDRGLGRIAYGSAKCEPFRRSHT